MRDRIWANVVYHLFWGNCIMIWRERWVILLEINVGSFIKLTLLMLQ